MFEQTVIHERCIVYIGTENYCKCPPPLMCGFKDQINDKTKQSMVIEENGVHV